MALNLIHLPPAQYVAACAVYPYSEGLEASFARLDRFGDPYNMAVRVGNHLHVPRNFAPHPVGDQDKRIRRPALPAINCKVGPRNEDQARVIAESTELLKKGINHIAECPTGWGKTYLGSAVGAALCQPTLIVVTKNDLMKEWYNTLINLVGVDPSQIGKVQQDECVWQGKRFVLAMVHSLVKPDKYPEEMYRYFGMLVLDEVHLMGAETFVRTCQLVPAQLRLGLSATPDRSDGKMDMVKAHIGPVRVRGVDIPMIPKILVKQTGWKIPRKEDGKPIPHAPGKMTHITKIMAKDPFRNMEIAKFATAAYDKGRRILLVSELTDHLELMHKILGKQIPGNDIDYYIGGKNDIELDIAADKRIVLGTWKMVEYGTNRPQWDAFCPMTPRAKIKQGLGRILRSFEGKPEPIALDLVDYDSIFQSYYQKRMVEYYSLNATIVKI